MANGRGAAQCHYCSHFVITGTEHCKKHDFNLGKIKIEYEKLCKDYDYDKDFPERACSEVVGFKENYLYYYASQGPTYFSPLDNFSNLKYPIHNIRLLDDKDYGWLFEIDKYDKHDFGEKSKLTLKYKGIPAFFVQKSLSKQMLQGWSIDKGTTFKEREISAFVPEQGGKELLDKFIDDFVGLDSYWNKKKIKKNEFRFGMGISIFLREIDSTVYEIFENELMKFYWLSDK